MSSSEFSKSQELRTEKPSSPFVVATAISKRFGAVQALDSVSLELRPGEIVALAGENGSGKSTLAKVLTGVYHPDDGTLLVDGAEVHFRNPRQALNVGIAGVTQEVSAIPAFSVSENILLARKKRFFSLHSKRKLDRDVAHLLKQVGLTTNSRTLFQDLRPGEHVQVELAKSLSSNPRLLVMDEVTTRIGGRDAEQLFDVMMKLREQGVTIVYITHRLEEILRLCDRTLVLRDGKLVGEISRADATEAAISRMMVGRDASPYERPRFDKSSEHRLEVRDLRIGGFRSPVSFAVRPGEAIGLCGLVGSGRTEILENIIGLVKPIGGEIFVDGQGIETGSLRVGQFSGMAFVPEDRHSQGLMMNSSIRVNFSLGRWRAWRTVRRAHENRVARTFADRFSMHLKNFELPVSTLSGGNQQKVVIGRAISSSPTILLLDEPTRGVDVGARAEVFAMIKELLEGGMSIVLASSDMVELRALSHSIMVLHDRSPVATLDASEATEERLAILMSGGSLVG